MRSEFKKCNSRLVFMKNSLAKIALNNTKFLNAQKFFSGPVIIALSNDPVLTSRMLVKFANSSSVKLEVIGGMISNDLVGKEDITSLSMMPALEEIRTNIVTLINASARNIIRVLNEPRIRLTRILRTYAEK
jgi:large subunit ribosomal protein L10